MKRGTRVVVVRHQEHEFLFSLQTKWGNSLGVRLPKSIAREVQLGEGDTVQVSVDNGTIVIRPGRTRYSLEDLVRCDDDGRRR